MAGYLQINSLIITMMNREGLEAIRAQFLPRRWNTSATKHFDTFWFWIILGRSITAINYDILYIDWFPGILRDYERHFGNGIPTWETESNPSSQTHSCAPSRIQRGGVWGQLQLLSWICFHGTTWGTNIHKYGITALWACTGYRGVRG